MFSKKETDSQGEKNNEEEKYPLSLDQERVWYAMLQESTAFSYNVLSKIEVRGDFNLQCIPNILECLLQKFDALQLSFSEFEPLQSMNSSKNWLIDIRDLSLSLDKETDILHAIEQEKSRNFLRSSSAWSFHFFKYDKNHWVFILNFSHLIIDGWSLVNFIDSFFAHYFYLNEKKSSAFSHSLLSHRLLSHELNAIA